MNDVIFQDKIPPLIFRLIAFSGVFSQFDNCSNYEVIIERLTIKHEKRNFFEKNVEQKILRTSS
jgi:hypothetical protein